MRTKKHRIDPSTMEEIHYIRQIIMTRQLTSHSTSRVATATASVATAVVSLALIAWWSRSPNKKTNDNDDNDDDNSTSELLPANAHNQEIPIHHDTLPSTDIWHRAAYCLIIHEPPEQYYEPRDWAHTHILLVPLHNNIHKNPNGVVDDVDVDDADTHPTCTLDLVSQKVHRNHTFRDTAIDALLEKSTETTLFETQP